jgi:hypothetical protein
MITRLLGLASKSMQAQKYVTLKTQYCFPSEEQLVTSSQLIIHSS